VFFLLLPFAFRKLSHIIANRIINLDTLPKIIAGFLWGLLVAALFTHLIAGIQTLFMIFGYMSGLYCAALSYKRDSKTAMLLAPANIASLFTYGAIVLASLWLNNK
jgi:succinate dehydrogenase/fumarate reductase cytochrome b subunit